MAHCCELGSFYSWALHNRKRKSFSLQRIEPLLLGQQTNALAHPTLRPGCNVDSMGLGGGLNFKLSHAYEARVAELLTMLMLRADGLMVLYEGQDFPHQEASPAGGLFAGRSIKIGSSEECRSAASNVPTASAGRTFRENKLEDRPARGIPI
ncbi:hypothetical protein EVAR_103089_1 [Eumeta japonica]|uniref:Uncharacterized protein n=1 Tax=Eumeta variegata TaxID=151549 RepID=A0A4C1WRB4_EUMVA|nr:hypothetical protein EVAR_103089_1 [Eumeta japonica]